MRRRLLWSIVSVLVPLAGATRSGAAFAAIPVDLSKYSADCGVTIRHEGDRLNVAWPLADDRFGRLVIDLDPGKPLFESLGTSEGIDTPGAVILSRVDPRLVLTVGTRSAPSGRPPEMSIWNVFFDSPATRPHQSYPSILDLRNVKVASQGRRASITVGDLTIGPFSGELVLTFFVGAPLVQVEGVVETKEDSRAIVYDSGLVGDSLEGCRLAWLDPEGKFHRQAISRSSRDESIKVRHRAILLETPRGTIGCFPPPHQFFFPRDLTDNLATVWAGRGHRDRVPGVGFGVRQPETGGGGFVPWSNAPPGTRQHLSVYYLLSPENSETALAETLRYTHDDHFPELPGYVTFTSHWHMAIAVEAMKELANGKPRTTPDFVKMFKDLGVNIVHLAEFHGDGHQFDPGPLRLPELQAMFEECRRLSEERLLLLPGEEVSKYLGLPQPGRHPGHWMSLFPKPVYWTLSREVETPFIERHPRYGKVYHVGSREDVEKVLDLENGLVWTAHPRIKASSWTPDIFRGESFFLSDHWLGGAWKAMPSDLSRDRLGERSLDLLDDMCNWGQHKYVLGEVDVFKLDHTHELYGHMNVNYLKLDRIPRFEDDWQPVLDALRGGRFFVTTGEILLRDVTLAGKRSGETLAMSSADHPSLRAEVEWTFPLDFAEIVSGDGERVYRDRIDLADTGPFGQRTLTSHPDLRGRRWVRFEVWDVAHNGAFTQPIWLEP